jgi:hypothetical protein
MTFDAPFHPNVDFLSGVAEVPACTTGWSLSPAVSHLTVSLSEKAQQQHMANRVVSETRVAQMVPENPNVFAVKEMLIH